MAHEQVYRTDLVALNNSLVEGEVTVTLDSPARTVTVDIHATGLEPNQAHIQHIHGFADDSDAKVPGIAFDSDRDGFVELAEGLPSYGPIQLNLTLNPENAAHDHGTPGHDHTAEAVFPTVGADGVLDYRETFRFAADDPNAQAIFDGITPLDRKEIVLHGMSVAEGSGAGTPGEVDGTAGYKLALPVASGELRLAEDGGGQPGGIPDWNAIAAQATANFEASGSWFI